MASIGSSRTGLMDKPMSVEQIVKTAADPLFDPQFSMTNWFRTADLMLKQASIYEHEGDDQMAYFLLYRHAHLILDDLSQHPHARDPEHRTAWAEARKSVKRSLAKLEILKPRINKRYERSEERRRVSAARTFTARGGDGYRMPEDALAEGMRRASLDAQGSRSPSQTRNASPARLDAVENRDLAVKFANRELRRRAERDQLGNVEGPKEDVSTRMVEARRQMDLPSRNNGAAASEHRTTQTTSYNYPHVPEKSRPARDVYSDISTLPPTSHQAPRTAPNLPPKEPPSLHPYRPQPPTPTSSTPPSLPSKTSLPASPTLPSRQFASASTLENGTPLRTVFLPTPLRHRFLSLAHPNTIHNLETCAMLCGTLLQNAFFITHLVVPEQTATSDTCEMINEAALHEYCDSRDLMVLGWIHTHPSQTCFMSSRDLHTHVWFQVQLPESVAIVCAPSKSPDWGIFRLTDPPGISAIRTCKSPGIFHPHSESHIFTDALGRPGHVIEHEDLRFEVVDLRSVKGRG